MSERSGEQAVHSQQPLNEKRLVDEDAIGVSQSESDNDSPLGIVKDWDGEEAAVKRKYVVCAMNTDLKGCSSGDVGC
jgi:hypothetical protein